MEEDGKGRRVSGEDDDLRHSAVEGLGGLIGALLQLSVMRGLLHDVEDFLRESRIGYRPG